MRQVRDDNWVGMEARLQATFCRGREEKLRAGLETGGPSKSKGGDEVDARWDFATEDAEDHGDGTGNDKGGVVG
jgi:hypothetical protein